ncbi:SSI family serine proteinase inhibitor [Streptomyces sp. NPDC059785]|uniref:SSI family serine proteinase inhibitor n=1 Tax=Streptomyces sp. NPDC059785 TaxID=3346945 RepID=UPI003647A888
MTRTAILLTTFMTLTTAVVPAAATAALPAARAAVPFPAGPGPAGADQARQGPGAPGDWLYLTVATGDGSRSGETHGTLLLCDPPQGHARAAQACAELRAADGDIARIRPLADAVCPMVYAPVTVSARGRWAGRATEYRHTFANPCVMEAETRTVFTLTESEPGPDHGFGGFGGFGAGHGSGAGPDADPGSVSG